MPALVFFLFFTLVFSITSTEAADVFHWPCKDRSYNTVRLGSTCFSDFEPVPDGKTSIYGGRGKNGVGGAYVESRRFFTNSSGGESSTPRLMWKDLSYRVRAHLRILGFLSEDDGINKKMKVFNSQGVDVASFLRLWDERLTEECRSDIHSLIDSVYFYSEKIKTKDMAGARNVYQTEIRQLIDKPRSDNFCQQKVEQSYVVASMSIADSSRFSRRGALHTIDGFQLPGSVHTTLLTAYFVNQNRIIPFRPQDVEIRFLEGEDRLVSQTKIRGAYDCENSSIFMNIEKGPMDVASTVLHELSHMFRDKKNGTMNIDIKTLEGLNSFDSFYKGRLTDSDAVLFKILMDEVVAVVTAAIHQFRITRYAFDTKVPEGPGKNAFSQQTSEGSDTFNPYQMGPESFLMDDTGNPYDMTQYRTGYLIDGLVSAWQCGLNISGKSAYGDMTQDFLEGALFNMQSSMIYGNIRGDCRGEIGNFARRLIRYVDRAYFGRSFLNGKFGSTKLKHLMKEFYKHIDGGFDPFSEWLEIAQHVYLYDQHEREKVNKKLFHLEQSELLLRIGSAGGSPLGSAGGSLPVKVDIERTLVWIWGNHAELQRPSRQCSNQMRRLMESRELDSYIGSRVSIRNRLGVQLGADGVQPGADGVQPGADGVQPGADGVQPGADGVQPGADGVQPGADGVQPGADGVQPSFDGLQPSIDFGGI